MKKINKTHDFLTKSDSTINLIFKSENISIEYNILYEVRFLQSGLPTIRDEIGKIKEDTEKEN